MFGIQQTTVICEIDPSSKRFQRCKGAAHTMPPLSVEPRGPGQAGSGPLLPSTLHRRFPTPSGVPEHGLWHVAGQGTSPGEDCDDPSEVSLGPRGGSVCLSVLGGVVLLWRGCWRGKPRAVCSFWAGLMFCPILAAEGLLEVSHLGGLRCQVLTAAAQRGGCWRPER